MEWSGNGTAESNRRFMLRFLNGDCGMREWDVDVGLCGKENQDNLSEWLRRQTRNLLGFARAGSNPAVVAFFCSFTVRLTVFSIVLFSLFSTYTQLFTSILHLLPKRFNNLLFSF